MKKLTVLLMLISTVFLHGHSLGADWRHLGSNAGGSSYFYDSGSVIALPGGVTKVWQKTVVSGDEKKFLIKIMKESNIKVKKDFNDLAHTVDLIEINCTMREIRFIESHFVAIDGSILHSLSPTQNNWNPIRPESLMEGLYKAVCTEKPRSEKAYWD